MTDWLWQLDEVSLSPGRLRGVSVRVPGGVTAVLGQSGAGKTSLLNVLIGYERADGGTITPSQSVTKKDAVAPLFWSPQDGGLWSHLTARQHLTAVMPARGGTSLEVRRAPLGDGQSRGDHADALLDAFDLTGRADAKPDEMSMGQRMRLSVARTLASEARVMLMDEPLAHVDVGRVGKYWSVIRDHVERTGASLLFATHSPQIVLAEAARVICMDGGRVLFAGDVDTLYERPPTLEAARCLGEVNWFEDDEASVWLNGAVKESGAAGSGGTGVSPVESSISTSGSPATPAIQHSTGETPVPPQPSVPPQSHSLPHPCVRPEKIELAPDPAAPLVVQSHRFRGMVSDVQLHHERHNRSRSLICRAPARLHVGQRVAIRLLTAFLLAASLALFAGCSDADGPRLDVQSIRFRIVPPDGASLPSPRAVAMGQDGELIVLDKAGRVLIFDDDLELLRQWRMPKSEAGKPEGACQLADGRIAVADTHYSRIVLFDREGHVAGAFGSLGREPGQFIYPVKVIQDAAGFLYVIEYGGNDRVQKFTVDGEFVCEFGAFGSGDGEFQRPAGIVWHEGKVYVADADNHRVQVFTDDGEFVAVLGEGGQPLTLDVPYDLSLGPDGLLYIVEYGGGRVTAATLAGELVGRFGRPGRARDEFSTPWGVAVDARKRVWVADTGNRRIVELQL